MVGGEVSNDRVLGIVRKHLTPEGYNVISASVSSSAGDRSNGDGLTIKLGEDMAVVQVKGPMLRELVLRLEEAYTDVLQETTSGGRDKILGSVREYTWVDVSFDERTLKIFYPGD